MDTTIWRWPIELARSLYNAGTEVSYRGHIADRFEGGAAVANRLRILANDLPHWHSLAKFLPRVADRIAEYTDEGDAPRSHDHPSLGSVGRRPVWAALTVRFGITTALRGDPLRVAILLCIGHEGQSGLGTRARSVHHFLQVWDGKRREAPDTALTSYLRHPSQGAFSDAHAELLAALETCEAAESARTAATRILRDAHQILLSARLSHTQDYLRREARVRPPVVDGAPESIPFPDGTQLLVSPRSQVAIPKKYESQNLIRSGWLVERVLMPLNPAALLSEEGRDCGAHLMGIIGAPEQHSHQRLFAALVSWCAMLSSEGHRDLIADLVQLPNKESSIFRIQETRAVLRRRVPGAEDFAKIPPLPDMPTILQEWNIPLHGPVAHAIRRIASREMIVPSWDELESELGRLDAELRQLTPRYTEGRARLLLPMALYDLSNGDVAWTQMLGSSDLGHSAGPLAYVNISAERAQTLFGQAARLALGTGEYSDWGLSDEVLIGAPLSALPDRIYRELTDRYKAELRSAIATRDPEIIHDALTIYAARLLLAATGHRGHRSLAKLRIQDIDPCGLCLLSDKPTDRAPGIRVASAPELLISVLADLLTMRRDHVEKHKIPDTAPIAKACAPDGLVFTLINPGGRSRRVTPRDIRPPSEWALPVNVFRARLRMHLTNAGVWPRLIYSQMGHLWNGESPFGAHTLEPLLDLSGERPRLPRSMDPTLGRNLQHPLPRSINTGLISDGWERIRIPGLRYHNVNDAFGEPSANAALSQPFPTPATRGSAHLSTIQLNKIRKFATEVLFPLERRVSESEPVLPGVNLDAADVDELLAEVLREFGNDPHQVERCLDLIWMRVIRHRRRRGWCP